MSDGGRLSPVRLDTRSPEEKGQPGWAERGQGRGARAAECHLGTGVRQILSCFGLELALRFLSGSTGGGIPGCLEEICR